MKEYVIDCEKLTDISAAHDYLKELFGFPEYYGMNLDALHDCLTELPPCRVSLIHPFALEQLGAYASSLLRVFTDAAEEMGCIELV